mgnify:CR=1 FL=1
MQTTIYRITIKYPNRGGLIFHGGSRKTEKRFRKLTSPLSESSAVIIVEAFDNGQFVFIDKSTPKTRFWQRKALQAWNKPSRI